MSSNLPAVVIGGGVVGLACASELARRGWWVLVLEKEEIHGRGTSSRNSEVIHAGIYYEPGSLKARFCREGRDLLYDYLGRRNLPFRRCGKLIVATDESELPRLRQIQLQAENNGVEDLRWLTGAECARLESGVRAIAALESPSTGIVDAHSLMDALAGDVERSGGDFVFCAEFQDAEPTGEAWRIRVRDRSGEVETFEAALVVNAAGLHADEVARRVAPLGESDLPRQTWVKGNYYSIRPGSLVRASRLIYPCPRPDQRGLGVHLTLDLGGGLRLGPDVELLPERVEDYSVGDGRAGEFFDSARKFLPNLAREDLAPGYAGLRPQRVVAQGFRDFYIADEAARGAAGWINMIGIESPGLTAALAIGQHVANLADEIGVSHA